MQACLDHQPPMGQPQRCHGSALAADLIRACAGWPRDLAARGSRARGLPAARRRTRSWQLDDHAQHASLRHALSSARSRLQQILASATAVRAPAQHACIALHCAGIAMHGHACITAATMIMVANIATHSTDNTLMLACVCTHTVTYHVMLTGLRKRRCAARD